VSKRRNSWRLHSPKRHAHIEVALKRASRAVRLSYCLAENRQPKAVIGTGERPLNARQGSIRADAARRFPSQPFISILNRRTAHFKGETAGVSAPVQKVSAGSGLDLAPERVRRSPAPPLPSPARGVLGPPNCRETRRFLLQPAAAQSNNPARVGRSGKLGSCVASPNTRTYVSPPGRSPEALARCAGPSTPNGARSPG